MTKRIDRMLLTLAAVLCWFAPAAWAQEYRVEYTVALEAPQTQTVRIVKTVHGVEGPLLHVHLPVWRPGRYEVLDLAGTIREASARSGDGRALPMRKTAKSTWSIRTEGVGTVHVDYLVYANSIGNRTRHVDDSHAFLSGSAVFMYVDELRGEPLRVRVDPLPEGWRVATGLEPEGDDPRVLVAPDYDILADSPLEIGVHDLHTFELDGAVHEIVVWGQAEYDAEDWKRDFAKIVQVQRDIFGDLPYDRYVFICHVGPGMGGGTEHYNSTVIQAPPDRFSSRRGYERWLRLVSHETFHTWNVKRFRPSGIQPYDYLGENYTRLLWIAEGSTSYYDRLTLVRAGITGPREHFRDLAGTIHDIHWRPGAGVQPLEDASFDAWIKFNKPTPDSVNATVSFYSKGALVSMMLDMELRRRTDNRVSYDDVMRELYERFPLDSDGYTTEDVLEILYRLSGSSFEEFFRRYVSGTEPLPMGEALAVAGLELRNDPYHSQDAEQRAYLGFTASGGDLPTVRSVLSDGPAYAAGLNVDDRIVAVNGRQFSSGDMDSLIDSLGPGDEVRVVFTRRTDELRELVFTAAGRPSARPGIARVSDPTDEQRAVYESWLGRSWDDWE